MLQKTDTSAQPPTHHEAKCHALQEGVHRHRHQQHHTLLQVPSHHRVVVVRHMPRMPPVTPLQAAAMCVVVVVAIVAVMAVV
jgi:hypothetical protein